MIPQPIIDFLLSDDGYLLREDVLSWAAWYGAQEWYRSHAAGDAPIDSETIGFHFEKLFFTFPEFRSLFDYRTISRPAIRGYNSESHRRATDLYIAAQSIGPGFRIQHGHSTYIFARDIGRNFWINHHVTVGAHRGIPKIGDGVTIRTGAVVVGPIQVGNDVTITANAVVNSDVPDSSVVYAPRSVIVTKGVQRSVD